MKILNIKSKTQFGLIFVFIFGFAFTAMANESQIKKNDFPESAIKYLNSKFPNRSRINYFQEQDNSQVYFEAEFKNENKKQSVKFLSSGEWVETETEFPCDELNIKPIWPTLSAELSSKFKDSPKLLKCEDVLQKDLEKLEINLKGIRKSGPEKTPYFFEVSVSPAGKIISIEENTPDAIETLN